MSERPSWRRAELVAAELGEQLVEMACCGFRYSAYHTDADGGYTCPLCEPDYTITAIGHRHVEINCPLPPGHIEPCVPGDYSP